MPENLDLKKSVWSELDGVVKKSAVFATNTSGFAISDLNKAVSRRDKFIGFHWFSPAYSPDTRLFYVAVRETGGYYYKSNVEHTPGAPFIGGGGRGLPGESDWGAIRALDVLTGRQRWEFRLYSPPWAGLLATAGGLVFSGTNEGNIFALDARTGTPLWDFQAGGQVRANPVSYLVDGRQYVAVAAGRALFVFSLP